VDTKELETLDSLQYSPVNVNGGLFVTDVLLPTLTTLGWPVRKSRIQLQREVFSPRVLSLVVSFVDTMVLNVEL
jgi:hypothetical protein